MTSCRSIIRWTIQRINHCSAAKARFLARYAGCELRYSTENRCIRQAIPGRSAAAKIYVRCTCGRRSNAGDARVRCRATATHARLRNWRRGHRMAGWSTTDSRNGLHGGCLSRSGMQLENLIASKVNDHQGMMATLRNDTEQFIGAQQDELRRIQAMINSLIEQRQTNYQFARQPGDLSRY